MQQKPRDDGHKNHNIEQGTSRQESVSEHLEEGVEEAQLAVAGETITTTVVKSIYVIKSVLTGNLVLSLRDSVSCVKN